MAYRPEREDVLEFGTEFIKILWKDGLTPNIRTGHKRMMEAAWITAQREAPNVENYMKVNAPWTDRTGNARNGLAARAYKEGDGIGIVLYHQVDYGIYLETKFSGRDAIIQPSIDSEGPRVMASFNRLLERM